MWSRIGIKTEVEATAPPVFFKNRDEFKYSAYLSGWGSDSGEMSNPLRALAATPNREKGMGGTNRGRYSNPAMDAKLEEAMRTVDDTKREALLQEASRLVIADYGLLPLYFELSVWAMRRDLTYVARADQATLAQFVQPKPHGQVVRVMRERSEGSIPGRIDPSLGSGLPRESRIPVVLRRRVAQLDLHQVDPVGGARRQDLVAEIVERRMDVLAAAFAGAAVADHDVGAGLLLEHEGEVLRAGDRRDVGLDLLAADRQRGGLDGDRGLVDGVDQRRIAAMVLGDRLAAAGLRDALGDLGQPALAAGCGRRARSCAPCP